MSRRRFHLLQVVRLERDLPEGPNRGALGTIVDLLTDDGTAFEVEIVDQAGNTVFVGPVAGDDLEGVPDEKMREEQDRTRAAIDRLMATVGEKIDAQTAALVRENLEYNELGEAISVLTHGIVQAGVVLDPETFERIERVAGSMPPEGNIPMDDLRKLADIQ